jgi:hypothetical protein
MMPIMLVFGAVVAVDESSCFGDIGAKLQWERGC